MKFAIICPGPSLHRFWPGQAHLYDRVIAVNLAGAWYDHDWFAAWDHCPSNAEVIKAGRMRLGYLLPVHCHCMVAPELHGKILDPMQWWPPRKVMKRLMLTGPITMLSALGLGATEIHVYGNDMKGSVYADGSPTYDADQEQRWRLEPVQWERAKTYVASRGCRFTFYRDP